MSSFEETPRLTSDKLTVELVSHSLIYISEEMGVALRRSAYSPNIRERADHSCAVLDPNGRTIGQAEHIPVHIGSFALGLRNTLQHLQKESTELRAGDMIIVNDPYISGTHLNDITLVRPVYLADRVLGFIANKAHHVDIGGISPASLNPFAQELGDEGIIIQPLKLMEKSILRNDIVNMICGSSRMPKTTMGDLRAQIAANLLGERRMIELAGKFGVSRFWDACERSLDQTHSLALSAYAEMPKGTWTSEDYLELGDSLLPINERVTISDDGVEVDFQGTAPQVRAPLNAVLGVTTAAVNFAVKTLMPQELPLNDGFHRTIKLSVPEGTIVNPLRPAPVAGGNVETSQRIVDTTYKALSAAMPDKIPAAAHGSMNNLMMGGTLPETGGQWAFYETIGGGYGGRNGLDGVDAVQVNMTNTMNTPIEVMEHYYPIRFESYTIRHDSGGLGEWRGGMGIERSFTARARIHIALIGERTRIAPYGLWGGLPGRKAEYFIVKGNGERIQLRSKDAAELESGDRLVICSAGGGGFGDPTRRNTASIQKDLADDYLSEARNS